MKRDLSKETYKKLRIGQYTSLRRPRLRPGSLWGNSDWGAGDSHSEETKPCVSLFYVIDTGSTGPGGAPGELRLNSDACRPTYS
jgi:hypothetical protein